MRICGRRLVSWAGVLLSLSLLPQSPSAAPHLAEALGPEVAIGEPSGGYLGRLIVAPEHGPAGTPLTVTAEGLPAGEEFQLVWRTVDGAWKVTDDIFNSDAAPASGSGPHVMLAPGELKWGDAPPSLPPGAKMAVVQGDPTQAQPFVVRAQVPAGYKVPPHWHPGDENITVLSGTVALGMGEQFDESKMTTVPVGGYASLPAEMRHYFMAKTATTFQVHGMGPFVVNYVNPADDPSTQKK